MVLSISSRQPTYFEFSPSCRGAVAVAMPYARQVELLGWRWARSVLETLALVGTPWGAPVAAVGRGCGWRSRSDPERREHCSGCVVRHGRCKESIRMGQKQEPLARGYPGRSPDRSLQRMRRAMAVHLHLDRATASRRRGCGAAYAPWARHQRGTCLRRERIAALTTRILIKNTGTGSNKSCIMSNLGPLSNECNLGFSPILVELSRRPSACMIRDDLNASRGWLPNALI